MFDPKNNINAGTAYLKWLRSKYGFPAMFAAYNAGPGTVEAVMAHTRALPAETRLYHGRASTRSWAAAPMARSINSAQADAA